MENNMKKLLTFCFTFIMMFTLAGCSSQTEEEKAVTGLWNAKYIQAGEEFVQVPDAYCALEVKEDKTAVMSVIAAEDDVLNGEMSWAHTGRTDSGMYAYEFTNREGGVLLVVYSPEDELLILISAEDTGIVFEKVE